MKKIIFYIIILGSLSLFWNGKSDIQTVNVTQIDTNLIYNPSFEFDTLPSDTAWFLNQMPSNPVLLQNAPPGGGIWSIGLIPADELQNLDNADYYITGINGANKFTLNLWWKIANRDTLFVRKNATVTIGIYSIGSISQAQTLSIPNRDTVWTQDSISFPLFTRSSDTIIVRLCGGICAPTMHIRADGLFLFDQVQLIKH